MVNTERVLSLPAAPSSPRPMKISESESFSPSTSEWTRTSMRSFMPGFARRSAMYSIVSFQARVIISTTASSVGRRSSSPNPSTMLVSSTWRSSSDSGVPMKEPITRETTGAATSLTSSTSSWPSTRSRTRLTIPRMRSSCSAIRFGVKPRWKRALIRSCRGGSIEIICCCWPSSGIPKSSRTMIPPTYEEKVSQSRLTLRRSSARVSDQKPASAGYSSSGLQWTGASRRRREKISCGGPSVHRSRSPRSTWPSSSSATALTSAILQM